MLIAAPFFLVPGRWTVVGVLLVLLAWSSRWLATGRPVRPTPLDGAIVLLIAGALIGAAVSTVPAASASKLWGIVYGVAIYYEIVGSARGRETAQTTAGILVAVGALIAAFSLVATDWRSAAALPIPVLTGLYASMPTLIHGLPGSGVPVTTNLVNAREVGGTLALLVPLGLALLLFGPARPRNVHVPLVAAVVLMAGVLLFSQTLSGIGGTLIVVLLFLSVRLPRWRQRLIAFWATAGLLAASLALFWLLRLSMVLQAGPTAAPSAISTRHAVLGFSSRLELWPRALRMLHDVPYTGIGLNTFPWVMDRYYPGFLQGAQPHAHNFVLQTWLDLGMVGLVGLVWLTIATAHSLLIGYRCSSQPSARAAILGIAGGLLSFMLFGSIDAITLGAKPGVLLWAVLGCGMALAPGDADQRPLSPAIGSRPPRHAPVHADTPRRGRLPLAWRATIGIALALLVLAPVRWGGPWLDAGRLAAYRALAMPAEKGGVWPGRAGALAAIPLLDRAIVADPTDSDTWYLLGRLQARLERPRSALTDLQRGVVLDRHRPLLRYALGQPGVLAEPATDWQGLLLVYQQWIVRYPTRAVWYATRAIAQCDGVGDEAAATATISAGEESHARPQSLLVAYGEQVMHPGRCRPLGNG